MLSPFAASYLFNHAFLALSSSSSFNPLRDGHSGDAMREWSSTIGIVTAIAGNLLISFALNIQRYAHIRIGRESARRRRSISPRGYGTASTDGSIADREIETQSVQADPNSNIIINSPSDGDGESLVDSRRPSFQRYRDDSDDTGFRDDVSELRGPDRLRQSFHSDQTLTPTEKIFRSRERKSYLQSPYWWAGIVLMTIGEAGNFLAYGFAPASIVSPLGVVALISNCIIAPFMLKETFRQRDFWGVLISISGAVTIVLSAKTSETKIGPEEIWGMITQWEFELYLGITVTLIATLMWCSKKYGGKTILIDLGLVALFGRPKHAMCLLIALVKPFWIANCT